MEREAGMMETDNKVQRWDGTKGTLVQDSCRTIRLLPSIKPQYGKSLALEVAKDLRVWKSMERAKGKPE